MKSKRISLKRTFLFSCLSVLLCVSMLVGTTFAWFTDSVTSGINRIVAGNLDIELYLRDNAGEYFPVDSATSLFDNNARWEPGYTQIAYFKLQNLGSMALKYSFAVTVIDEIEGTNVNGETFKLSDFLVFNQIAGTDETIYATREEAISAAGDITGLSEYSKNGQLNVGESGYIALIVYMPSTVGNEANYKGGTIAPGVDLGVTLVASQLDLENDSMGSDYDSNAVLQNGDKIVITLAQSTVEANTETVINLPANTPAGNGSTKVAFPANAIPNGVAVLNAGMQSILEVNPTFEVTGSSACVASLDFTLNVDGESVTSFAEPATITTYIEKYLTDVVVKYGDTVIPSTYDSQTGKLVFNADHFSVYNVFAKTLVTTENDVEIWNEAGLRKIAFEVNSGVDYSAKTIKLMSDIDMGANGFTFVPIGTLEHPYTGIFDGNGKTIFTNRGADICLFMYAQSAAISNLNYNVVNGIGTANTAALVCVATDTSVSNVTINADITGRDIAGVINDARGNITLESVTVNGQIKSSYNASGMIVYANQSDSVITITNCINNADITTTERKAAGFVNCGGSNAAVSLTDCTNNGNITATQQYCNESECYVGGFFGCFSGSDVGIGMENCINNGVITANRYVSGDYTASAGGIAGALLQNVTATLCNVANNGSVTAVNYAEDGNVNAGGIIGMADENSDVTLDNVTSNAVLTAKTVSESNLDGLVNLGGMIGGLNNCAVTANGTLTVTEKVIPTTLSVTSANAHALFGNKTQTVIITVNGTVVNNSTLAND